MAVLEAREIYRIARQAGFDPAQATTMTAIALAESGGDTGALNAVGEHSVGPWQINLAAHPELVGDPGDPLTNARWALAVSGGGADISPWTVTHGGGDARYLAFRTEAEVAARLNGEVPGGTWTGVDGYGDATPAGGVPGGAAPGTDGADETDGTDDGLGWHQGGVLQAFLDAATAQAGDTYVFGADVRIDDADPDTFDCSGLVSWAAGRVGVDLPHASWKQYLELKELGYAVPVEEAVDIPGALLFSFPWEPRPGEPRPGNAHVAISLGDGRTIEAMNPSKGVLFASAERPSFTFAAVIPGISDGTGTAGADPGLDSDGDGLPDVLEQRLGLDLFAVDTDGDGLSDGYELLVARTRADLADTDADGIGDAREVAEGWDPLVAGPGAPVGPGDGGAFSGPGPDLAGAAGLPAAGDPDDDPSWTA